MSCPYFDPDQLFTVVSPAVILIAVFFFIAISLAVLVMKTVIFCSIFAKAGYHWFAYARSNSLYNYAFYPCLWAMADPKRAATAPPAVGQKWRLVVPCCRIN